MLKLKLYAKPSSIIDYLRYYVCSVADIICYTEKIDKSRIVISLHISTGYKGVVYSPLIYIINS